MLTTIALLAITAPTRLAFVTEVPFELGDANRYDAVVERVAKEWVDVDVLRPGNVFGGAEGKALTTCGADVVCLSRELGYLDVHYLALIVATRIDERVRLVVRLVDTTRGSIVAKDARDWSPPRDTVLQDSLRTVLAALPTPKKSLLAVVMPVDALVTVKSPAGDVVARGIGPHSLSPGRYRLRGAQEGHEDVTRDIELVGGERSEVALEFRPKTTEWYASPWFWGVTIGVVAAGVAVGVAVSTSRGDQCLCIGRDLAECPPPC